MSELESPSLEAEKRINKLRSDANQIAGRLNNNLASSTGDEIELLKAYAALEVAEALRYIGDVALGQFVALSRKN